MSAVTDWIVVAPREEQDAAGKIRMFPSGRYVNPLDVAPDDIDILDIAHHLSLICRYTGGVPWHYSVAQHSVLVSEYLMKPEERLAGLLHDAAEAYMNDMASPVKHDERFKFFCERDAALTATIFERFNLDPALIHKTKPFDDLMFERESATFFGDLTGPKRITSMSPAQARQEFMNVFRELRPEKGTVTTSSETSSSETSTSVTTGKFKFLRPAFGRDAGENAIFAGPLNGL